MIIALIALGWVFVLVLALSACRMSALADESARVMFPLTLPAEQSASLRKAA